MSQNNEPSLLEPISEAAEPEEPDQPQTEMQDTLV